jgi:hypothetical protein
MIIFAGAPLVGRGEFANALRWKLTSTHDELLSGKLGPGRVSWRGRQLEAELGYRGPSVLPRLTKVNCDGLPQEVWDRYRRDRIRSLQRATGVLFVIDRGELRSVMELQRIWGQFEDAGRRLADVPCVFALNKRDLPNLPPVEELRRGFGTPICDHIETSATTGLGVAAAIDRLLAMIDERSSTLR